MERANLKNLVTATLSNHLGKPEHGIREDSELVEDLGADSLDIVELTLIFEEMFHVEIPDDDVEQITTVGDIVNLLEKKVSRDMVEEENVPNEEPVVEQTPPEEPEENQQDEGPEDDPEED